MSILKGLFKIIKLFLSKKYTNLNDIANSYTRVSKSYNDLFLKEMQKYNKEMLDKLIIRYIDNKVNSSPKVLDIACGTGFNSKYINSKINNSSFTLVDISEGMLNEAKKNLSFNAEFIKNDMVSYLKSLKTDSFDIVVCSWAIKYQNPHEIIKEVSRVLKKGGYFAVIVNLKYTLPEVRKIYPKLILKNYSKVNKIMKELPNPIHHKTFTRWFEKESFSKIEVKDGSHVFTFDDTQSLVSFVTSTGALAGFDAMIDMTDEDVKNSMIKLFDEKGIKTITHKYVWGIFKNDK
ncbi:class I SAM-dependent methyltransferase [Clostridium sp. D46t1_190503_E9]|uniref:class I SAM-dependent methyltransferase n=1 Tax=Clostridium sp. D46t1_190503_E9 TaxID=2787137 RepID=UPI001897FE4B|nr:class I SAM-dependent methyltransferase [Clostridium sp. D46t1_190503_E9]